MLLYQQISKDYAKALKVVLTMTINSEEAVKRYIELFKNKWNGNIKGSTYELHVKELEHAYYYRLGQLCSQKAEKIIMELEE